MHRFPSAVLRLPGPSLRWDVEKIFDELLVGVRRAAAIGDVSAISVDSWGVDYVLIARDGSAVSPPFHYRDGRTAASYPRVLEQLGSALIFAQTGIQFMPINTLYQLACDDAATLDEATAFLTVGDYFNFRFSGVPCVDESLASTTQLYDPRARQWAMPLIERSGLPAHLFPKIVPPGTVVGRVLPAVCEATALPADVRVIATCSHDTGAAVAAVPADAGDDWAYLSSGTWSLLGVELQAPLINVDVRAANFTNEAGFGGTTRLLKNIVGLWIVQELRREWAEAGQRTDYAELVLAAREAEPFRSIINPADVRFALPGNMQRKIEQFCIETTQPSPATPGQFVRCVLESLALLYRATLADVERLTGRPVRLLHIVGGGSRNELLNQFAASATGRRVIVGPVEASAAGNVLVQAIALQHVPSLAAARAIVRESFPTTPLCRPTPTSGRRRTLASRV